jgi:hypothetical protein
MEADLVAQRCALFYLSRRHPEWTYGELAAQVGRRDELGEHMGSPLETRDHP